MLDVKIPQPSLGVVKTTSPVAIDSVVDDDKKSSAMFYLGYLVYWRLPAGYSLAPSREAPDKLQLMRVATTPSGTPSSKKSKLTDTNGRSFASSTSSSTSSSSAATAPPATACITKTTTVASLAKKRHSVPKYCSKSKRVPKAASHLLSNTLMFFRRSYAAGSSSHHSGLNKGTLNHCVFLL